MRRDGQLWLVVDDGRDNKYKLPDSQLTWQWRLVMTSETVANAGTAAPFSLVIAKRAAKVKAQSGHYHRPGRARLFKTSQRQIRDVYFTKCRRCFRTWHIASVRRDQNGEPLSVESMHLERGPRSFGK